MKFEIDYFVFTVTDSSNEKFSAKMERREFTISQVFDYVRDCPISYRSLSRISLVRLQTSNLRLIRASLQVLNLEWEKIYRQEIFQGGLSDASIKKFTDSIMEVTQFIREQNQLIMLEECVMPYQKIAARRCG